MYMYTLVYKRIKYLNINEKPIRTENCISILDDSCHLSFTVRIRLSQFKKKNQ